MKTKNKTKYCCTGLLGFIGSNLLRKLLEEDEKDIESYTDDVSLGFCPKEKPDVIIHLAANVDTTYFDDIEMYRSNIVGFLNVLKYATDNNIKLIYASSGAIYGNDGFPLNAYGETKWICDKLAKRYFKTHEVVGLRFFNVYGPFEEQKDKMASTITQWRNQIQDGKRPIIFDGEFKRDFVYVKDVVKAILMAKTLKSGIYDVGTGVATDFRDVLKIIIKLFGDNINPKLIKNPHLGKYQTFTKANLDWEFKPDYTIESGIKDYFENYE